MNRLDSIRIITFILYSTFDDDPIETLKWS